MSCSGIYFARRMNCSVEKKGVKECRNQDSKNLTEKQPLNKTTHNSAVSYLNNQPMAKDAAHLRNMKCVKNRDVQW